MMALDQTFHPSQFIFSLFLFNFLFFLCGRLSWLHVSFYCTLNTQYRIVSSAEQLVQEGSLL